MARRDSVGGYEEERFKNNQVDIKLQCSICLRVLKDPVQCPHEHYFCHSCIRKHLHENSETCPMCQDYLTEETLTKPARILTELLESLEIRCDHAERGCPELIELASLDRHVESCDYSPARCTNVGCAEVMNRREKEGHERKHCHFRKIVCGDCGEQVISKSSRVHPCFMRKEMDDLARRLNDVQNDMTEVKDEVKQVKLTQEEMACLTKEAFERCNLFTGQQTIFVCGGRDGPNFLNSVESYSWPENSWTLEPAMTESRSGPSAFIHERQIYVAGGRTMTDFTDSIESLNVEEEHSEWTRSPFQMPSPCTGHKMVSHGNSALVTGGRESDNAFDRICKISLNPPNDVKLLTRMPEPRCHHGCQIMDNQVIVAGGRPSPQPRDAKNTVYVYDISNNEWKTLLPLPFAISDMAIVSYKGNVILIGGVNKESQTLNSVVMYNVKTGKSKMLPCLNHKRASSAAVITGNVIIAMGGYNYETNTYLNSVEYLDLNTNVWRELSPMTTNRSFAIAVLKPLSQNVFN